MPPPDFNRLAYRRRAGKYVELWFMTPARNRRWDAFAVTRDKLGARLLS